MPSASPMYTFSTVFTEPGTPFGLPQNGSTMEPMASTINDNINTSNMFCMDFKNGNFSEASYADVNSGAASCAYDPFKCLSAMAEQSLTGNFHTSSSSLSSSIAGDNIHAGSRGSISAHSCSSSGGGVSTNNSRSNSTSSNVFTPFEQPRHYQSCDRNAYSLSSSSSISSSSPPLSPASSCCMFTATTNLGPSSDFLANDNSNFHKMTAAPANQTPACDFLGSDSPFSHSSSANQNSVVGGESDVRSICKKSYPSCSSDSVLEESDRLLSWTMQYPENWSHSEVLDWIFYVAQERGLDMQEFRGENFQSLTGAQLCQMRQEDFIRLEPKFGRVIYEMFRKLLCGVVFHKPVDPDYLTPTCIQNPSFSPCPPSKTSLSMNAYQSAPPSYPVTAPDMNSCNGPAPNTFFKQERCNSSMDNGSIDITSYDFDLDDTPSIPTSQCQDQFQPEYVTYPAQYSQTTPMGASCCFPPVHFPTQLPRRRPGRPRVKSLVDDERSSKEKKGKNQHLWEFIYETLMNPMYNPQYLRWENQRDGVFRFVQSEAVAQLWGGRKNNENMTYEKLSRAMRHYYRRGILERVEGRRLVYKFSIKAMERAREKRSTV